MSKESTVRIPLNISTPSNVIEIITTTNDIPNHKIVRILGIVRGISVRSRNIFVTIYAALCSCVGGKNESFTHLCEVTREEATDIMRSRASAMGIELLLLLLLLLLYSYFLYY